MRRAALLQGDETLNTTYKLAWALAGALGFSISAHAVMAADLPPAAKPMIPAAAVDNALPAVSGVNGKVEVVGGEIKIGGGGHPAGAGVNASLSAPLGHDFGIQGDALVRAYDGSTAWGVGGHLFTRNPHSYLFGIAGASVTHNGTTIWGVGPEAELYMGRFSLEAFGGFGGVDYPSATDKHGGFGFLDLAWYPTDDWRLAIGGSSVYGYNAFHLSTEYQFQDTGTSLTGNLRTGNGATTATVGIKFYFGDTAPKSLIARHRQDDPGSAPQKFQTGAGTNWNEPTSTKHPPKYYDTESACRGAGYSWNSLEGFCYDPAAT